MRCRGRLIAFSLPRAGELRAYRLPRGFPGMVAATVWEDRHAPAPYGAG